MKKTKYKQLITLLDGLLEQGRFIRESRVRKLNRQQVKLICEICLNIIRSNIILPDESIDKIKKYKSLLEKIIANKINLAEKKHMLLSQQGGNFLSLIIPSVLQFLLK